MYSLCNDSTISWFPFSGKIRKSFFSNSSVLTSLTDLVEIFLIQMFLASEGIKQKLLKSSKIMHLLVLKFLSQHYYLISDSKILFKYSELNDSNSSSLKILSSSVIISSIESSSIESFILFIFLNLEETISKYFL